MALQGSNFEDTFKIDLFNDGTATVETFGKSFTMWIEASSQGEITLRNEYNEVLTISNFAGQSRLELPNLIGELKNCLVGTLRKLF